jgi:hypothetical protein
MSRAFLVSKQPTSYKDNLLMFGWVNQSVLTHRIVSSGRIYGELNALQKFVSFYGVLLTIAY